MADRFPKAALALLLFITVARGVTYVLVIPPWQTPDEPSHFGYVQFVMQTHSLAVPRGAPVDSAITASMSQFDFWRLRYHAAEPSSPDQAHGFRVASRHPPLYYVLGALLLSPLRDQDIVCQLHALRWASVLMAACTVLLAFCTTRLLFAEDAVLPLAVTAFITFLPMHTFMSASVNNDSLAELVTALLVYLLALTLRDGLSSAKAVGVLVLLSAGFLTKRTTFFTLPLAIAYIPVYLWTRGRRMDHAALTAQRHLACVRSQASTVGRTLLRTHKLRNTLAFIALLGLICGTVWLSVCPSRHNATARFKDATTQQHLPLATRGNNPPLPNRLEVTGRQILSFLTVSPANLERAFSVERSDLSTIPSYFLFSLVTFASFWANFGWMNIPLDPRWYALLAVISLLAFSGLLLRIRREISSSREQSLIPCRWQKGFLLILTLASLLIFLQTFGFMVIQNAPQQGRYLFPAIVPLSTLFMLGLSELLPTRYRHELPLVCVLSLFLFDAVCLARYILPHYYV